MNLLLFIAGLVSLAGIYAMLCLALNLSAGILGLWDLGIAGFFAIGAYAYTITTFSSPPGLGLPMWVGVIAAGLFSLMFGFLIGLSSLRLKAEYLLITTFAFAEVIRQVIANEAWLTKGNVGFYGISRPFESYFPGSSYNLFFALMVLIVLFLFYWLTQRLVQSPMGRLIRAVRENESVTTSVGKNIFRTKLIIFVVSTTLTGVTGAFYIWYSSIIVPGLFTSALTFTVWTALVLGGIGNNKGAVLGAFVLILAQELTRFIEVSPDMAVVVAGIRQLLTGLLLILVLRFLPQGILRETFPSVESMFRLRTKGVLKGDEADVAS